MASDRESTWDEFECELRRLVPVLGSELSPETPLSQILAQDRIVKGLVTAALRELLYEPPEGLLENLVTLGDAAHYRDRRSWARRAPDASLRHEQALRAMQTQTVRLRAILPSDIPELYASSVDPRWSFKWRFRGATPSLEEFAAGLTAGVHAQFVVERLADRRNIGLIICYNARLDHGYAYIAFLRIAAPTNQLGSEMLEGGYVFISFIFRNWNFRKLYAEVPGFTWPQFEAAQGSFFEVEARLRNHDFFDGRYWDHRICALYKDKWEREAVPWLSELYGPSLASESRKLPDSMN